LAFPRWKEKKGVSGFLSSGVRIRSYDATRRGRTFTIPRGKNRPTKEGAMTVTVGGFGWNTIPTPEKRRSLAGGEKLYTSAVL